MMTEARFSPVAKMPKQMKHWFEATGIYVTYMHSGKEGWSLVASSQRPEHLKGCLDNRRYFRVLGHIGVIQVCDGSFDRWANSVSIERPIPKTEKEFKETLAQLTKVLTMHEASINGREQDLQSRITELEHDFLEHEANNAELKAWVRTYGTPYRWERRMMRRYYSLRDDIMDQLVRCRRTLRHLGKQRQLLKTAAA